MTSLLDSIVVRFQTLWAEALYIWLQGGWAMIAIAVIAFVMFAVGMRVFFKLRRKGFRSVPEARWREWIDRPGRRRGPIGELLDFVTGPTEIAEMAERFTQLRVGESRPFERDLRVMKVCVSAAPLVGLLGTVTGMLSTFSALSSGSGGDKTMGMVAKGISEALITTETGLVVALPGLFFQYQLSRNFERYKAFLAHLETVCTQVLFKKRRRADREAVRRAASVEVARKLKERVAAKLGQARPEAADDVRGPEPAPEPQSSTVLAGIGSQPPETETSGEGPGVGPWRSPEADHEER